MRCKNQLCRKFTPPKVTEAHQVFLNVKPHCTGGVEAKELLDLNDKKKLYLRPYVITHLLLFSQGLCLEIDGEGGKEGNPGGG